MRFAVVGVSGTIIDFTITYLSKEVFRMHKYVANGLGFMIAATSNYVLNRYWTFNSNNPRIFEEYMHFLIIATIGLIINTAVLYFLHHNRKMNFYLSKLLATGAVLIWNFLANYFYTFATK